MIFPNPSGLSGRFRHDFVRGCPRTRFSPCDEYRIENIRAEVDSCILDELIDLFVSEGPKLFDNI